MENPATYLHWGFVLISIPNLMLLGAMILIFVAALLLPFPAAEDASKREPRRHG